MEPLARVELSSDAPAEVIRLLPLVGLEPVSRISTTSPSGSNLADASLVAIRVDFAAPRTPAAKTTETGQNSGAPATIAIAFDSIPPLGTDLTADLVTDSAVAAVCFILSRILGLASAFLTTDPNLFDVIRAATAVARGPARILVEGELGVGKESLIKLIHAAGRVPSGLAASRERPGLVHAECAGLEADAVESEIAPLLSQVAEFNRSHSSNGGAIFFNRIGELPPAAQRKLLDLLRTFAGVLPLIAAIRPPTCASSPPRPGRCARWSPTGTCSPSLRRDAYDLAAARPPWRSAPTGAALPARAQFFAHA